MSEKLYHTDCSDQEWEFAAPYLTLMTQDAPQRDYPLRHVFNALRYVVRSGCSWRLLPNDFPPYYVVYQQMQRWIRAGAVDAMVHDLREFLRLVDGRSPRTLRRRSLILALCSRRSRAARGPAMMEPRNARATKFI